MLTPEHIVQLLVIASQLSGLPLPAGYKPPIVKEVNTKQMQAMICPHLGHPGCDSVVGFYHDGTTIWVDAQYASSSKSHFSEDDYLIHEMTHWLQKQNGHGGFDCPNLLFRELEAYNVQGLYMNNIEHKQGVIIPSLPCGAHIEDE